MFKCQTLRKIWYLELFRWDLSCYLTLKSFLRADQSKKTPCILDQIVYISVIKPWSPASQLVPGIEGGENGQRRLPLEKLVA